LLLLYIQFLQNNFITSIIMLAPLPLILVYNQYIDKKISDYFHLFLEVIKFSKLFKHFLKSPFDVQDA